MVAGPATLAHMSEQSNADRRAVLAALAQVEVLKPIPADDLAALADHGRLRSFPVGSRLLRQGDEAEYMYIILKGRVRVEYQHPGRATPRQVAELGAGDVVGEIGVLSHQPRTASATALEDTEALQLSAAVVAETLLRFPQVWSALLQMAVDRARRTRQLIGLIEVKDEARE